MVFIFKCSKFPLQYETNIFSKYNRIHHHYGKFSTEVNELDGFNEYLVSMDAMSQLNFNYLFSILNMERGDTARYQLVVIFRPFACFVSVC